MKCANAACCRPAGTLQCPVCLGANNSGPETFFCSQDCYKSSWNFHKLLHNAYSSASAYNPHPGFKYSGPLRPYPQSATRRVPASVPKPDYAETGIPASEYSIRKTAVVQPLLSETIKKMRVVCKLGREVLEEAKAAVKIGATSDEIDRVVHDACIERSAYPSPLNYRGFPKSCCTSVNEVICHGIPDFRPMEDGDILNIDISLFHDGVHGDLNDTVPVGAVDSRGLALIDCARECLNQAIGIVKPGTPYREVGEVIEKYAKSQGFSVVRTYCGHGINELFHCAPTVAHYARNKSVGTMRAGHVFTIEPMINEGTWQDMLWPDDWTAVTVDGKRSAQFEHTLLVTDDGCDILTK